MVGCWENFDLGPFPNNQRRNPHGGFRVYPVALGRDFLLLPSPRLEFWLVSPPQLECWLVSSPRLEVWLVVFVSSIGVLVGVVSSVGV